MLCHCSRSANQLSSFITGTFTPWVKLFSLTGFLREGPAVMAEEENTATLVDEEPKNTEHKGKGCDRTIVFLVLGIICYFASNIGINLFNKWMFRFVVAKMPN